ncbi:serine/threonine-protein kinase [Arenimonas oryziterrae]|uniref:Protein kinase domain-containing protein n=1 Tax=Arenimonas oryziterrae DSM 21050 = YC6267 TaxID=1121015 RepID=A0A091BFE9_9GAMM|nr:serine/threonine-protein kinase [Arenimonas oryziterrae]KFN43110.1 hypothetical protein N789_11145 [Arenimonas oryziterrae DSM 21050 = YC6267]
MIAGYKILHELGRGGMATVYRAVQESLGREVALKVMAPELARDPAYAERFLREGKVVARLRHRNIVTVHDIGVTNEGAPYMAMEFVPGGSVAARIGSIDAATALRCVREIGSALDHAHRNGVVHRDVKPENILCHEDGSFLLSDFGVARLSEATSSLTAEGATLGTPQYMSPEQWRGEELDGRSDLYALGVLFYQLLTGAAPYSGTDGWAIGMQHMTAEVPRLPADKAMFQPLLDSLLAKQRENRPMDGAEVARRADLLLSQLRSLPPPPPNVAPAGLTTPLPARPAPPPRPATPPPALPRATPAPVPPPMHAHSHSGTVQRAVAVPAPASSSKLGLLLAIGAGGFLLLILLTIGGYFMFKGIADKVPDTTADASDASSGLDADTGTGTDTPSTDTGSLDKADDSSDSGSSAGTAPDPVVKAELDSLGVSYEIDEDGDFKILQRMDDGRTQQNWVRTPVEEYGTLRVREIWSVGYRAEGEEIPQDIALQLLRDTHDKTLGGWTSQTGTAVFVVKIPADASADQLKDAIDAASSTADAMELVLTGSKDEF